ncbi:hypothetical protein M422DRAFT_240863 [Sphaerobolus stellatus SS14]|nr:hypothetical protein M422DRAFT_240863 [Sphaerobolus stellatus SS14]
MLTPRNPYSHLSRYQKAASPPLRSTPCTASMHTPPPSPPRRRTTTNTMLLSSSPRISSTKSRRDRDPIPMQYHPSSRRPTPRPESPSPDLIFSMSPPDSHIHPPPPRSRSPRSVFVLARQQTAAAAHPMRPPPQTQPLYSFPKPGLLTAKMREREKTRRTSMPISGTTVVEESSDSFDDSEYHDSEHPAAPIPVPILTSMPSPSVLTFGYDAQLDDLAFPHADDRAHPSSKKRSPKRPTPLRTQSHTPAYPPHPLMRRDTSIAASVVSKQDMYSNMARQDGYAKISRASPHPRMTNVNPLKSARTTTGPIRIVGFDADDREREDELYDDETVVEKECDSTTRPQRRTQHTYTTYTNEKHHAFNGPTTHIPPTHPVITLPTRRVSMPHSTLTLTAYPSLCHYRHHHDHPVFLPHCTHPSLFDLPPSPFDLRTSRLPIDNDRVTPRPASQRTYPILPTLLTPIPNRFSLIHPHRLFSTHPPAHPHRLATHRYLSPAPPYLLSRTCTASPHRLGTSIPISPHRIDTPSLHRISKSHVQISNRRRFLGLYLNLLKLYYIFLEGGFLS